MPGILSPFQGDFEVGNRFPGLKPWAILFSPFGRHNACSVLARGAMQSFSLGFTKADKGFFRQAQAAVLPVEGAPLAGQLFSSQRHGDE